VFWYENGNKKTEWNRIGRRKYEGKKIKWYENGQIEEELNYVSGIQEGTSTTWYKNGQKSKEQHYKDGSIVKTVKWDKTGKITN
jgi:antitoxin component YwqK of YwqJK toxin-antitoxin module